MAPTAPCLVLIILVLAFQPIYGNVIIYPSPQGVNPSNKFQVFVSQGNHRQASVTYIATSDIRAKQAPHVTAGRSVSWTSFAFTGGPVTVEIHAPTDFKNCIVRPKSYGYACKRMGPKKAQITVSETSRMMSIEFDNDYGTTNDDDIKDKLLVFADPPETNVPDEHDSSVLYYKAGVHNLNGQLHLDSKIKTVYLAPGAWVEGGFITSGQHPVTIRGRGILSTQTYKWHDHRFAYGMVTMDKGNHHVLEGITMVDPEEFYFQGLGDHNTVRNVKMIAPWAFNSDGVGMGHDGVVLDTFIWANDDAFKVYTSRMVVERCVVWLAQNGAVFQMGWTHTRDVHNVSIKNVDVIHVDLCNFHGSNCKLAANAAVFNIGGHVRQFKVSDIVMSNIRVEGSCPRLIYYTMKDDVTGSVSNIHFDNWTVDSQPMHDSLHNEINGSAHGGMMSNWTFTNLKVGGHCITGPKQADFLVGSHTSNIKFICH
ncbi:dextranase [Patella vulgata]|uniref:dextranase n=1 Tax=Patella vulgata TaxID=6465 RepID=UPI0024A8507B|nr:dextranase [Patella vulgata]